MSFNDPASGGGLDLGELNGSLLLFTVHKVEEDIPTTFGPKDAVRADVAVLDGEHKGDTYPDTLVFPLVLQNQLRQSVGGSMVLGRLGQGNAKPGQKPPWTLTAASDDEKATGEKYLAYVASQTPMEEPAEEEQPF